MSVVSCQRVKTTFFECDFFSGFWEMIETFWEKLQKLTKRFQMVRSTTKQMFIFGGDENIPSLESSSDRPQKKRRKGVDSGCLSGQRVRFCDSEPSPHVILGHLPILTNTRH